MSREISTDIMQKRLKLSIKSFTDVLKKNVAGNFHRHVANKCKISMEGSTDVLLEKASYHQYLQTDT